MWVPSYLYPPCLGTNGKETCTDSLNQYGGTSRLAPAKGSRRRGGRSGNTLAILVWGTTKRENQQHEQHVVDDRWLLQNNVARTSPHFNFPKRLMDSRVFLNGDHLVLGCESNLSFQPLVRHMVTWFGQVAPLLALTMFHVYSNWKLTVLEPNIG
jgi:hypothetical protein